jgi:peptide/nickel transport system permease protein
MTDRAETLRPVHSHLLQKGEKLEVSGWVEEKRKLGMFFWLAFSWIVLLIVAAVAVYFLPFKDPLEQNRVACTSPFIGMAIGLTLGMAAGYFRGKLDSVVSIFIDSILAFPNIVLAIAVLFYAGPTMSNLILVISFYTIPQFTRIARANTILYAQREFVLAAHAQGASHLRILYRELFPNVFVPVAAFSLLIMSFTIVLEGGLSFLGVGLPPPTPTWGRMIADGIESLADDPKIVFIPSLFMFLTILSLNLMGDRLRAFTDVKASNV